MTSVHIPQQSTPSTIMTSTISILHSAPSLHKFLQTDIGEIFMLNRLVQGSYVRIYSHQQQKYIYRYINVDTEIQCINIYDINQLQSRPVHSIHINTLSGVIKFNNTTIQLTQSNNDKQYSIDLQYNNQPDCDLWYLTYTWLYDIYSTQVKLNHKKLSLNNKQRHVNMIYCMELLTDCIELAQLDSITNQQLHDLSDAPQSITLHSSIPIDQLRQSIRYVDNKISQCEQENRELLVNGCAKMIELQGQIDALYASNEEIQNKINALKN